MLWHQQPRASRFYLFGVYCVSIPIAFISLTKSQGFGAEWLLLTLTSIFVSTINVRLPKISSVISMGDVFIVLSLLHFGPGPALVTYWIDTTAANLSDVFRRHGRKLRGKIFLHRFLFNIACCAMCIYAMHVAH